MTSDRFCASEAPQGGNNSIKALCTASFQDERKVEECAGHCMNTCWWCQTLQAVMHTLGNNGEPLALSEAFKAL